MASSTVFTFFYIFFYIFFPVSGNKLSRSPPPWPRLRACCARARPPTRPPLSGCPRCAPARSPARVYARRSLTRPTRSPTSSSCAPPYPPAARDVPRHCLHRRRGGLVRLHERSVRGCCRARRSAALRRAVAAGCSRDPRPAFVGCCLPLCQRPPPPILLQAPLLEPRRLDQPLAPRLAGEGRPGGDVARLDGGPEEAHRRGHPRDQHRLDRLPAQVRIDPLHPLSFPLISHTPSPRTVGKIELQPYDGQQIGGRERSTRGRTRREALSGGVAQRDEKGDERAARRRGDEGAWGGGRTGGDSAASRGALAA